MTRIREERSSRSAHFTPSSGQCPDILARMSGHRANAGHQGGGKSGLFGLLSMLLHTTLDVRILSEDVRILSEDVRTSTERCWSSALGGFSGPLHGVVRSAGSRDPYPVNKIAYRSHLSPLFYRVLLSLPIVAGAPIALALSSCLLPCWSRALKSPR